MYDFVAQMVLVGSLAVIVYLMARALPRTDNFESIERSDYFDKAIKKLPLEKADLMMQGFFEKFLRKLKIAVLKVDNLINEYLGKIKQHNQGRSPASEIRE